MKERNRKEPTPMKMMRNIDVISDDVHAIILLSFMLLRLPEIQPLLFFGNCFAELYIYKKDVETLYCCPSHLLRLLALPIKSERTTLKPHADTYHIPVLSFAIHRYIERQAQGYLHTHRAFTAALFPT